MATCVGAILAGGESRRMGAPKAGVLLGGRPMIEHVLAALSSVCPQVVIVGACQGYENDRIPRLPDLRPGLGPLAGIEAVLRSGLGAGYLIAACDQPFLIPELLARLAEGGEEPRCFREEGGAGFHPFPCYFPTSWLPQVEAALEAGRLSMRGLLGTDHPEWPLVSAEEKALLRSVNRPEDLGDCDAH